MKDEGCLHRVFERLWIKSRELVKNPSGEGGWTEALHVLIDELKFQGLEVVRNRGKFYSPHD